MSTTSSGAEYSELQGRAETLRARLIRAQHELHAASVEERAISERLAVLGHSPTPRAARKPSEETTVLTSRKTNQIRRISFITGVAAASATLLVGVAFASLLSEDLPAPRKPHVVAPDAVGKANVLRVKAPKPKVLPAITIVAPPAPPAMGSLTVVCLPECDRIVDTGRELGLGNMWNRPASAGTHKVQVFSSCQTRTATVDVKPQENTTVRFDFGPIIRVPPCPEILSLPSTRD